ncbi:hypothetical protein D5S19_03765 [Amycolatopsis panacis]|uniref:Uncharacterized protein n=1 Tax=Amycolatopsis panacis TaxID=2340917 RepID=A0A419IA80_9PSEU|nr:hypothetical protein D5S19_03765 [Amycolatopsis panacis]
MAWRAVRESTRIECSVLPRLPLFGNTLSLRRRSLDLNIGSVQRPIQHDPSRARCSSPMGSTKVVDTLE